MSRDVIVRQELMEATLDFGGEPIDLADYATTGLRIVAIGPSGTGKTNAGLLAAEQLSAQGWVSVLFDPEGEIASMYGQAVRDVDQFVDRLVKRSHPFVVVNVQDAETFIPYGEALMEVADSNRKPLFVVLDEGQVMSSGRQRKEHMGRSSDLINDLALRGRKRALDLFVTANRYTGSVHRALFANKNITLIGAQEDPTAWASLAPQFKGSRIEYTDLAALSPGEFFLFTRRGVDRVRMPMAARLKAVAPKANRSKPLLPVNFSQWNRAMNELPDGSVAALDDEMVKLLGALSGCTSQQMISGVKALNDEREARGL